MKRSYWVYILTNYRNTVLYTGVTNNLPRRIWEHGKGLAESSFTRRYRLYKLVWYAELPTAGEAIVLEKRIKGWKREKKLELIKRSNPFFRDLRTGLYP
ncbi:GIY-YIG nuclease family protein [Patescibacteria group bacterium]